MITTLRAMPGGVRLFLVYALLILTAIGVALPRIVERAISAPITFEGLVLMILLAYTIFTTTLVLQRKEAGRPLAIGLSSLTLPAIPLLALGGLLIQTLFVAALAALLFRGLLAPATRAWLSEP
jgi:hypothetical protein